jgi:hypothetical protein
VAEREAAREAGWAAAEDRAWEIMLSNPEGVILDEVGGEPDKVQKILGQFAEHTTYATSAFLLGRRTHQVKLTAAGREAGLARGREP